MRDIAYKRKEHTAASFFRGEILGTGSFILAAETAPDVSFPSSGCHGRESSAFLASVGSNSADKFIFTIAAAHGVIEERKVLSPSLRGDLARLFDTRHGNLQVIVVGKCCLDEVLQPLVLKDFPPRQVSDRCLLS